MYNLDKVLFKLNCFVILFFTRWTAFKNCMLTACHHRESKQVTNTNAFLFFYYYYYCTFNLTMQDY